MTVVNCDPPSRSIITHNCVIDNSKVVTLLNYLSECKCDININDFKDTTLSFTQLLKIAIQKCDKWLEIPNLNDLEYTADLYVVLIDHVYSFINKSEGCILLELFLNKLLTCNFDIRSQLTKLKFIKQWFIVMRNDNDRVGIWCKYLIRGCTLRKFTTYLLPTHEELIRVMSMDIPLLIRLDLLAESIFVITHMISQPKVNNINDMKTMLRVYFKLLFQNADQIINIKDPRPEFCDYFKDYEKRIHDGVYDKSSYMVAISNNILNCLVSNIRLLALVFNQNTDDIFSDILYYITHNDSGHQSSTTSNNQQNISNEIIDAFNKFLNTPLGNVFKLMQAIVSLGNDDKISVITSILTDNITKQFDLSSPEKYYDISKKIDFVYKLKPGSLFTLEELTTLMPSISTDDSTNYGIESFLIHLQQNHLLRCEIDAINNTIKIIDNSFHCKLQNDKPSLQSSLDYITDMANKLGIL